MTVFVAFTVDGDPVPKGRARVARGRAYTPARTVHAENVVAWQARTALGPRQPSRELLSVRIVFHVGNRRRRDLDNLAKTVLDALNGIVWVDDSQIAVLDLRRRLDPACPRTEVSVGLLESEQAA